MANDVAIVVTPFHQYKSQQFGIRPRLARHHDQSNATSCQDLTAINAMHASYILLLFALVFTVLAGIDYLKCGQLRQPHRSRLLVAAIFAVVGALIQLSRLMP